MKSLKFPTYTKNGTIELLFFKEGIKENFANLILGLISPGLIIKKVNNGILDTAFLVSGSGPLNVNPGYLVYNDGGDIRLINFTGASLAVDAITYPNGTYYLCIVPKGSNYEQGTVSFTNGSNTVTINSKYQHLRAGGFIIIENADSIYGNGGEYKVVDIGNNSATIDTIFNGTSESNLKWKIGGAFPINAIPSTKEGKLVYEYDAFDLILTSSPKGYDLAEISVTAGVPTINRDRRAAWLAEFNNNRANSDNVLPGGINNITTIDEKAAAGRLDATLKDLIKKGIRSGLVLTLSGPHNLTVGYGVAYDGLVRRINLPAPVTFDLQALRTAGTISEGDNYLHILYKSPNTYDFYWGASESGLTAHVLLGIINYNSGIAEE